MRIKPGNRASKNITGQRKRRDIPAGRPHLRLKVDSRHLSPDKQPRIARMMFAQIDTRGGGLPKLNELAPFHDWKDHDCQHNPDAEDRRMTEPTGKRIRFSEPAAAEKRRGQQSQGRKELVVVMRIEATSRTHADRRCNQKHYERAPFCAFGYPNVVRR